jgi:hypothetical protein
MRIGTGKSAKDRAILVPVLPMFEPIFAANAVTLRRLVADDLAGRAAGAPDEPAIPAPRRDGLFSEMPTITYAD